MNTQNPIMLLNPIMNQQFTQSNAYYTTEAPQTKSTPLFIVTKHAPSQTTVSNESQTREKNEQNTKLLNRRDVNTKKNY
jgi:hypothetical protein